MPLVDRFYRVSFADDAALRDWTMGVLEVAAARDDAAAGGPAGEQVVFVPIRANRGAPAYGYVSEGALGLATGVGRGVELEGSIVSTGELPDGLTLVIGDDAHAGAYERRGRE